MNTDETQRIVDIELKLAQAQQAAAEALLAVKKALV